MKSYDSKLLKTDVPINSINCEIAVFKVPELLQKFSMLDLILGEVIY